MTPYTYKTTWSANSIRIDTAQHGVYVRIADDSNRFRAITLPTDERREAAQALAGSCSVRSGAAISPWRCASITRRQTSRQRTGSTRRSHAMTDQFPTTAQVRHKFATVLDDTQGWRYSEEWGADFDRWLADHIASAVQAERERVLAVSESQELSFLERAERAEATIERAHAVHREHTNTGLVERCKCLACDMARALNGTGVSNGTR